MANIPSFFMLSTQLECMQQDYDTLMEKYDNATTPQEEAAALDALAQKNIEIGKFMSKSITLSNAKFFAEIRLD